MDLVDQIDAHAQKIQVEQKAPLENKVDSQQIDGQTAVQDPPTISDTPVAEEVIVEPETKVEEPKSWDADVVKEEVKPTFNFSQIGSALNWGEIKDENDFIKKATEIN